MTHILKNVFQNIVKTINLKVFDMVTWTNKARQIKWHESFKCECKLNASVCNNKQSCKKD